MFDNIRPLMPVYGSNSCFPPQQFSQNRPDEMLVSSFQGRFCTRVPICKTRDSIRTKGSGAFVVNNTLLSILFDYREESGKQSGAVARSVATSRALQRISGAPGLPVFETFPGLNHSGELTNEDKIVIGTEKQAPLSIKGNGSEEVGLPACLLATEAIVSRRAAAIE